MISRRVFLKDGAFALVSLGFAPSFLTRTAYAQGRTVRAKQLIAIFQRGAVDGLSVVVPFGESDYYRARPSIAIARPNAGDNAAIDLDGFFGFNPQLAPFKQLWDARALAIVHACGSPDSTRSHFDAQDYMETGTPGVKSTQDGWLNRYLKAKAEEHETPFRAVALAAQMPRALQGSAPAIAMTQIQQFGLRAGGAMPTSFESQYASAADAVLKKTGREAFDAMHMLQASTPQNYQPENGAVYPRSAYGDALRQIAQLIKADVGLEVGFTEITGWDHHVNEGSTTGQIANRLDDFSQGLAALALDLGDRFEDTIILSMSEFGRAVAENGNRGTDHGHGNAMLILGGNIRG